MTKFSGFDTSSVDSVEAPKSNNSSVKKVNKVFAPGLHSVKIISVDEKGPVKNDSTWEGLWITLEGTGGKQIYTNMLYPTESMSYNGQENSYVAQKFLAFVKSLGLSANSKTLGLVLTQLFSDPSKLVDRELQINVGYTSNHVQPSNGKFHLLQKYGRPVTVDGEPLSFTTREQAEAHCQQNNMKFVSFPEVTEFVAATELKTLGSSIKPAATQQKKAF